MKIPHIVIARLDRAIQKKELNSPVKLENDIEARALDSPNKSGNDIRWGVGE